jgi:FkbM family methyltransferase
MATAQHVRHAARRARQTFATFDNPVQLLALSARSRLPGRTPDLMFHVDGVTVTAPASRGAIFPIYEVFAEDVYRLGWFASDLGGNPVALDIGAHVGSFSLAFASRHPQARVAAYEASPQTASYLQRSVATSGLLGRVSCYAEAISTVAGFIDFTDDDTCSPLNAVTPRHDGQLTRVPSVTLETAFERLDGGVDLVKIDAEGVEYDIVLASEPALWASVSRVVLEYHEVQGRGREQLVTFFSEAGLRLVAHEPMIGNPNEGLMWFARAPFGDGQDPRP